MPYNLTAVSGQTISDSGLSDLNDIAAVVPGLVTADLGADSGVNNSLIMRGLNANNPGAKYRDYFTTFYHILPHC